VKPSVSKKKKVLIAVGVIAVAAVGLFALTAGSKGAASAPVQYITINKTSVSNSISASGVIESTDSVNVYSDLNYAVKEINVKVGDHVEAGQTLCTIDSKDLEDTIAQKLAAMQTSSAQSQQRIKSSQKKYNETKSNLAAGLNTQVNEAANRVVSAQRDLETAQQKLNDAKKHLDTNTDANLISARARVENAKLAFESAEKSYNDYKKDHKGENYDETMKAESRQLREKMQSAQIEYDAAKNALAALNTTTDENIADLEKAVATAQINYDNAVKDQKAILASVNQSLSDAADSITSDKLAADLTPQQKELEALQSKLAKCTVTAPHSGTVTAVYAKENAPAGGLMFVLEDTSALKMKVRIKESDIANVKTGMKAVIKADAISDKEFSGYLEKISPTSLKGKDGETVSSSNAEFEADVIITSKDSGLLIGMNGTADIILEEKNDVYAVPFDAITTDAQGKDIVYVAEQQKDGSYKATAVPVTLGIETDSNVEISGSDIKDGMKVITDGKAVQPGAKVNLATDSGPSAESDSSASQTE
jgi:multidrug efflux pump subunit AcrA (membrane-fusion protein)